MAMASPSTPSFSASCCCARTNSPPFARFPFVSFNHRVVLPHPLTRRLAVSSRLNSSNASGPGGSVSPDNGDYELYHKFSRQRRRGGPPVFVMLPVDAVGPSGNLRRLKTMPQSLRALAAAGVEGVVMEVWWGLVESKVPGVYDWQGYLELVALAGRFGLKVRAVMAFHECGTGPGDPHWIPLPLWVIEEIYKDPNLAYADRFGRRNMECISLGCDNLPVLLGRSPIQAYSDFMRNFRETFRPFLGVIITGIQVGMGPAGELRYPSCPSSKLVSSWRSRELGEFQCYDKYMLASLKACARETGMNAWGNGGPRGAGNLMQNPDYTEFFRSDDGSWSTTYGKFFLEWYSGMLLLHGERMCREAETIFRGTEVNTSAKVAGIHWHHGTQSHPSELTAGYYKTLTRDGYLPIARMFGRYEFSMCCACFEMQYVEEKQMNPNSSPEGFLRKLLLATRDCDIPLEGENFGVSWDDDSFQQMLKTLKFFPNGIEKPSTFTFMRMDKNMFEYGNWVRFTRFVRQMSDANIFQAKLGSGGDTNQSSMSYKPGLTLAYS
ncbi:beta-amylase 1, chloroplastic-like [Juglans microcarpa x Juglans regia]|uniref:beta-amylase 1, chloroplastic-like n=1 Tax=Juglans microcarpa x Juglans regia TaxID=2249226 RepID=UPI001B7F6900|nr:beta-amylase 1, chloroplastic-like [Juglans microcarpa x Juglans regia]